MTASPEKDSLSELLGGVSQGGRNKAATRLAGYFLGRGVPSDVVLATLTTWNEENEPPLEEEELAGVVASVAKAEGAASRLLWKIEKRNLWLR